MAATKGSMAVKGCSRVVSRSRSLICMRGIEERERERETEGCVHGRTVARSNERTFARLLSLLRVADKFA